MKIYLRIESCYSPPYEEEGNVCGGETTEVLVSLWFGKIEFLATVSLEEDQFTPMTRSYSSKYDFEDRGDPFEPGSRIANDGTYGSVIKIIEI